MWNEANDPQEYPNHDEILETRVKAVGDQVVAHLRDNLDDIRRVARTDPTLWTREDGALIGAVLYGVIGLIQEGRI
jgi:hypothetical protein